MSSTENNKDMHDHMKVDCKKCGKTIKVPSESPPNEFGYGCWKCFEKDAVLDTKPIKTKKTKKETENIDDTLQKIARWCINRDVYREHNNNFDEYHHFNRRWIKKLTGLSKTVLEGGYTFLDKECKDTKEKSGMIRLYSRGCNPKWGFCTNEDGSIDIDYC